MHILLRIIKHLDLFYSVWEDVCRLQASTLLLYRGLEQLRTLVFAEIPEAHPQQEHLYETLPNKGWTGWDGGKHKSWSQCSPPEE